MSDGGNAKVTVRMNPNFLADVRANAFAATQEVFEIDIKGAAMELSPVLSGTNRRSIDTEVIQDPGTGAVHASLFTQSGYGGYLEVGTYKMAARPYLFPAFNRFKDKIAAVFAARIKAVRKP